MNEKKLEEILDRKLKGVNDKLNLMNTRLQESIDSINFLSEKYDSCSAAQRTRRSKTICWLELRGITIQNKQEVNDLEQYSRRDCLEIRGVLLPDQKGSAENIDDVVVMIAEDINVELGENDI